MQAAATLSDEDLVDVGSRWRTRGGTILDPRPADHERMRRIRQLRALTAELNTAW